MCVAKSSTATKTAFVLAGGGSIGAVQVGMLRELLAHGVAPDLVVGSSVGAINGAYLAGAFRDGSWSCGERATGFHHPMPAQAS